MSRLIVSILFIAVFLLPTFSVQAFYKYVDENGRTIYVDDESKIPSKYLKKSKTLEFIDEVSDEEKAEQAERLRKARERQQEKLEKQRRERAKKELREQMETPIVVRGHQVLVPIEVAFGTIR